MRCGRVKLHTQELVIDLQDLHGLLPAFGRQIIHAVQKDLSIWGQLDLEPELALKEAERVKDRGVEHGAPKWVTNMDSVTQKGKKNPPGGLGRGAKGGNPFMANRMSILP